MARLTKDKFIIAPSDMHKDDLSVFQYINGHFCSVCTAPGYAKPKVEEMTAKIADPAAGPWIVVNSSDFGGSGQSPSSCNQDHRRQHWLLISR